MAARQARELNKQDVRQLENALIVARAACARIKSKVAYAGNIYDAADDVIHACEKMAEEARYA
jgi:hypothetical protein